MTPFVSALVTRAWAEYSLWTKPDGTRYVETDAAMTPNLKRYYAAVTLGTLSRGAIHSKDARRRLPTDDELQDVTWHEDNFWSAAFISYLFFAAGAGAQFVYALAHSKYVRDARNNLGQNATLHPFQAFPLGALPPAEGDVIVKRRPGGMHCDLIVDASARGHVVAIGGNVGIPGSGNRGLTVNRKDYHRDAGGFLRVTNGTALIKNFK